MTKTILVLAPHPDDAEFYAGGTLAKLRREGARVIIAIATDGCKGSLQYPSETLIGIRADEARRAAQVLGAEPPIFLGYHDQDLDSLPSGELRELFIRLIRQHKPDMVVAEEAFFSYDVHPDHRAVAWAASDALGYSDLPLVHPEHRTQGLEPHYVKEKLFYGVVLEKADRVIDVSETMPVKLAALAEHKSQMEFMVERLLAESRAAGLALPPEIVKLIQDPAKAIAWALETEASQAGEKIGVKYAEAFRYTRFHPFIESLVAKQEPK